MRDWSGFCVPIVVILMFQLFLVASIPVLSDVRSPTEQRISNDIVEEQKETTLADSFQPDGLKTNVLLNPGFEE